MYSKGVNTVRISGFDVAEFPPNEALFQVDFLDELEKQPQQALNLLPISSVSSLMNMI